MFTLSRLVRQLRKKRSVGVTFLLLILAVSIVGNALTFYFFDRGSHEDLTIPAAFWYSVVSITTIGYGDLSATSAGARIGTVFFVVLLGLSAFTTAVGIGVVNALEQGIPVIAVRENRNLMRNDLTALPWAPDQLYIVENYWEALGVMAAMKAGIAPESARRPLTDTSVEEWTASPTSQREVTHANLVQGPLGDDSS